METSVEFQAPMSFALWPIIVLLVLLILSAAAFATVKIIEYNKKLKEKRRLLEEELKKHPKEEKHSLSELKVIYINKIQILEDSLSKGLINNRDAYTELSNLFRTFVYEATGTPAHKYTLYDMRGLSRPVVYNLVNNYYSPEFSENDKGNILESIDFTKKAIYEWN